MPYSVTIKNSMENKDFLINQERLIFFDTLMEIPEITGFAFGRTEVKQSGMIADSVFIFNFIDSSGDEIKIDFQNNLFAWNSEEVYKQMSSWVWHYLSGRIYNNMLGALMHGIPFTVGGIQVSEEGLSFEQQNYMQNPVRHFVKWDEVWHQNYSTALVIRSQVNPQVNFSQDMLAYNAQVFASFLDSIQRDKSIISQFGTRKNIPNPYEKRN